MKFNQGFVTWSTRSLTRGNANGQGTVASSMSDSHFNQSLLNIESVFVRETEEEPVPFVMYSPNLKRFVALGISRGENYEGYTTQNLLVHVIVPETDKRWESFVACLTELPFKKHLETRSYMRTDLEIIDIQEDESVFRIQEILDKFQLDKYRLAIFLQRLVESILRQRETIFIVLPDADRNEMLLSARQISWLVAMALPKPAENTSQYLQLLSFGVGTRENMNKAAVVYVSRDSAEKLNPGQVVFMDRLKGKDEGEEALPFFRALSDKIIMSAGCGNHYKTYIKGFDQGEDYVWSELQTICEKKYSNTDRLSAYTLNMAYLCWKLEDPDKRGYTGYEDMKESYGSILVQTKNGNEWQRRILFNYLAQENEPEPQSVLALWKEVLYPALRQRDRLAENTAVWHQYLTGIVWSMEHVYDKSVKNYNIFLRELTNENDYSEVLESLYGKDNDDNIIKKEIAAIKTPDDYKCFEKKYGPLFIEHPDLMANARRPWHKQLYTDPATDLKTRCDLSSDGDPEFDDFIRNHIKEFFDKDQIKTFFETEISRTEPRFMDDAIGYYLIYLKGSSDFWNLLQYAEAFEKVEGGRALSGDDDYKELIKNKFETEMRACTLYELLDFPEENIKGYLDQAYPGWCTCYKKQFNDLLDRATLTEDQIRGICQACLSKNFSEKLSGLSDYEDILCKLWEKSNKDVRRGSSNGLQGSNCGLRMTVQLTWIQVCDNRNAPLRRLKKDYDVWKWEMPGDRRVFLKTWMNTLTRDDKNRLLRFPKENECRKRNHNYIQMYCFIEEGTCIEAILNKEKDSFYFVNRPEYNMGQLPCITDTFCLELAEHAFAQFSPNKTKVSYDKQLSNLKFMLSYFEHADLWKNNAAYNKLYTSTHRWCGGFFKDQYDKNRATYQHFVKIISKRFSESDRGPLSLVQGCGYYELREAHDDYCRHSKEIIKAIEDVAKTGNMEKDKKDFIARLYSSLNNWRVANMEILEEYSNIDKDIREIQDAITGLNNSLEKRRKGISNGFSNNKTCWDNVNELQRKLDQIKKELEKKHNELQTDIEVINAGQKIADDLARQTGIAPSPFSNSNKGTGGKMGVGDELPDSKWENCEHAGDNISRTASVLSSSPTDVSFEEVAKEKGVFTI